MEVAEAGWGSHVRGAAAVHADGSLVTSRSVGSEQWGRFLIDIFEEWVRRDVGTVFVQMFDATLANFVGAPPGLCIYSETCGNALAMEHTGDLYSCDHFVEPRYLLGNITETHMLELVASPAAAALRHGQAGHPAALLPRVRRALRLPRRVPQGPLHRRPRRRARPELPVRRLQGVLRPRHRPMRHMESLLRNRPGRPPRIMRVYAMEDAARGRNEACSCGSGRKFKALPRRRTAPHAAEVEAAIQALD